MDLFVYKLDYSRKKEPLISLTVVDVKETEKQYRSTYGDFICNYARRINKHDTERLIRGALDDYYLVTVKRDLSRFKRLVYQDITQKRATLFRKLNELADFGHDIAVAFENVENEV